MRHEHFHIFYAEAQRLGILQANILPVDIAIYGTHGGYLGQIVRDGSSTHIARMPDLITIGEV